MTLGDLKFKAEDFHDIIGYMHSPDVAAEANRILREKLEKAPIYSCERWNGTLTRGVAESGWYRGPGTKRSTHTARLVCVEEKNK